MLIFSHVAYLYGFFLELARNFTSYIFLRTINNLRIFSYNCQLFNSKNYVVKSSLKCCDILCIQETLLSADNSGALHINNDFLHDHVPAVRHAQTFVGRSSGGLAIYWKKMTNICITPMFFNDRIMGIRMTGNNFNYILLNVYCICDYGNIDSLVEYKTTMANISDICENETYDEIFIIGDLNCDPSKGRFFKELKHCTELNSLFISDVAKLPPNTYTYISQSSICSTSWLDHIISSNDNHVINPMVHFGVSLDDHIPISFELRIDFAINYYECNNNNINSSISESIMWDDISDDEISLYISNLDEISINIWTDVLSCNLSTCQNTDNVNQISYLYNYIIQSVSLQICWKHPTK